LGGVSSRILSCIELRVHIGLLIYGDIKTISGGYLYNRHLVSYLRNQGEQVTLISFPYRSYGRHLTDNFNHTCFKQLTEAKLDVLIQDAMVHPSLVLLNQRLSRHSHLPLISLVHLLTTHDQHARWKAWFYRFIERQYLQTVSGLIVNSQTTLRQVTELLPKPVPYCLAVPAGNNFQDVQVEVDFIRQRTEQTGPLNILVVGNVIRRKGLHVLINALRLLRPEDYQVTVAGCLTMDSAYVKQLKQTLQGTPLEASVIFKGPVQGQALVDLYQTHQLMVLPSAYESYGIVYVEAQQFGVPVIGTSAGAAQEIIRQGENGYLIPQEDHQVLATLLQTLHQDRALLLQLSQNALVAYDQHPKWQASCEIIRQFLYEHRAA
jgi:glycosyltransferase involved in cell wall biosynthesis